MFTRERLDIGGAPGSSWAIEPLGYLGRTPRFPEELVQARDAQHPGSVARVGRTKTVARQTLPLVGNIPVRFGPGVRMVGTVPLPQQESYRLRVRRSSSR